MTEQAQILSNEIFNVKEKLTDAEYNSLYLAATNLREQVLTTKSVEIYYMEIIPHQTSQSDKKGETYINIDTNIKSMIVSLSSCRNAMGTSYSLEDLKKRIGSNFHIGKNENSHHDPSMNVSGTSIKIGGSVNSSYMFHNCHDPDDCPTECHGYEEEDGCLTTYIKHPKNVIISVEEYVFI